MGSSPLQVSDLKTRLVNEAARLKVRTAEVTKARRAGRSSAHRHDYERVGITVAQDFVDYALDDLAHDRPARAEHVLSVSIRPHDTARTLRAYLDGKATPLLVPRFVTSKVDVRAGVLG